MKERKLNVYFHEQLVGSLAETADHRVAFAYENAHGLISREASMTVTF